MAFKSTSIRRTAQSFETSCTPDIFFQHNRKTIWPPLQCYAFFESQQDSLGVELGDVVKICPCNIMSRVQAQLRWGCVLLHLLPPLLPMLRQNNSIDWIRRDNRANLCYLCKQLLGSLVDIGQEVVWPIQDHLSSRWDSHVTKLSQQCTLEDWCTSAKLYLLQWTSLKIASCTPSLVSKSRTPPKLSSTCTARTLIPWMCFPIAKFNWCQNALSFSHCMITSIWCSETLSSCSWAASRHWLRCCWRCCFSMLVEVVTLLLEYLQMQLNILNGELDQSIDLTLAGRTFKIPPILYLSGMPLQERPVDLALANP